MSDPLDPVPGPGLSISGGFGSPPAEKGPGILQRILWLFSSPGKVFQPPRSPALIIVPLVLLSLSQMSQTFLLRDLYTARVHNTIEHNDKIPEEQKSKILENMDQASSNTGTLVLQSLLGIAGLWLLAYLVPSLLYLMGINFVMGGRARFTDVFAVTAFTGLIQIPRELFRVPLMLAKGSLDVYTSPAAFAGSDSPAVIFGLQMFDIFDLYRLIVLAVGLATISALPVRRAAYPVVVVWLLFGLAGLGCALSPIGQYMR